MPGKQSRNQVKCATTHFSSVGADQKCSAAACVVQQRTFAHCSSYFREPRGTSSIFGHLLKWLWRQHTSLNRSRDCRGRISYVEFKAKAFPTLVRCLHRHFKRTLKCKNTLVCVYKLVGSPWSWGLPRAPTLKQQQQLPSWARNVKSAEIGITGPSIFPY